MNEISAVKPARDYRLDILRTAAMLMVVAVHVANYYCRAFYDISSASYIGAIVYNIISRVSVPIFFMISGMLLLSRPVDLKKNVKRILNKLVYLAVITAVYFFWDTFYMEKRNINVVGLISTPERTLLWFMYAIIGIYIALPFIRRMVENMTAKEDALFVVLWVVLNGGAHLIEAIFDIELSYSIPILNASYYLGYFVLGYLIGKYKDRILIFIKGIGKKAVLCVVMLLAFIIPILITYFTAKAQNSHYEVFLWYKNIFTMLSSFCIFILIYNIAKNKENRIISLLAANSLEVYFFHGIALDFVMKNLPFVEINAFIGVSIFTVLVFILTLTSVSVIKWLIMLFLKKIKKF